MKRNKEDLVCVQKFIIIGVSSVMCVSHLKAFVRLTFCLTSFLVQFLAAAPVDFVDAMDESNYVTVQLTKPMGIVFEENDQDYGGIFVQSLKPDGAASKLTNGLLQPGDQLVAVNDKKVCGMAFDDALGAIVDSQGDLTTLTLFRGPAKQFYGKTGASQAWVDDFIKSKIAS
jgi:PDZ domain